MDVQDFIQKLKELGFDYFVGVPCSFFKSAINYVIDDPEIDYNVAVNEGAALAMANGAYLVGKMPVVLLQNSGFGNMVNPLTSLSMIYKIPTLLLISGRAYKVKDQPQHWIMGERLPEMFEGMGLNWSELPMEEDAVVQTLEESVQYMKHTGLPTALIVQKGLISDYEMKSASSRNTKDITLTRRKAIEIISSRIEPSVPVIATTGHVSRLLFQIDDQPRNFYMQGSMGHAISIGLGVAQSCKSKRVVVLDGDGAFLMHMGAISTVGHYAPQGLLHIVIDNEAYESTGGQMTTSGSTNMEEVARACGYNKAFDIRNESELEETLKEVLANSEGPCFLRIRVPQTYPPEKLPRIPDTYSLEDTRRIFMEFMESES